MSYNYDIKTKLSERAGKFFLDYILECIAGNREPLKYVYVTSLPNSPGNLVNTIQGEVYKSAVESNISNGELSLKINIPLGVEGSINYISLVAGSIDTGQIVETINVPTIEKLSIVSIELTVTLVAYDN